MRNYLVIELISGGKSGRRSAKGVISKDQLVGEKGEAAPVGVIARKL